MHDPRIVRLAKVLTGYSTCLQPGEKVLIEAFDVPEAITVELIRAVRARKATPFVHLHSSIVTRELARGATEPQYDILAELGMGEMKKMDAYIAVRGSHNITELSDVPGENLKMVGGKLRTVQDRRVKHTKWVVLRWPTASMAQLAGTSTEAFTDTFFKVCTLDYEKMLPAMRRLKKLMDATDQVHIKGPGTDLQFRIAGIPSVVCGGKHNIPDGEVFTAPVRNSVQGHVTFNAPTIYQGAAFDNVRLEFLDGKIIKATGSDTQKLNQLLDSDEGARHIGEFAIAFNPHILHPIRDILFDEKIAGSFHFTPGQAYEEADNGNRSRIHWDLVNIQRRDYGGGEIHFDGKLIRKNGDFVPKTLLALNRSAF